MKNIIGYVETEMKPFKEKPFCAVDSLVLAQLSYVRFEQLVPTLSRWSKPVRFADLLCAEHFGFMFCGHNGENNRALLFALAASPRFRTIAINYYVSKTDAKREQQFSAVTFLLDDGSAYIAFRGTDSTFVGWKEDFNMAYITPVPSQTEAAAYLSAAASLLPRSVRLKVGGHSKGGNLAVYAAMKCKPAVQDRITQVFSHDGPGFREELLLSPEFGRIESRIHKTLPQSSLIGMLLHDHERYTIVESNRMGGIMQHDPFSWSVGDGGFVELEKMSASATLMNRSLDQWLSSLSDERRKMFVDALFQVLEGTDASTFSELTGSWRKGAGLVLDSIRSIDTETRKFVSETIAQLVRVSVKNLLQKPEKAEIS